MRQNCHKKSFTFPFLLPCTTFQFDKGDQRQRQRQREDFQRHVKIDQRSTFCRHSTSSRRVKIRYKMRTFSHQTSVGEEQSTVQHQPWK